MCRYGADPGHDPDSAICGVTGQTLFDGSLGQGSQRKWKNGLIGHPPGLQSGGGRRRGAAASRDMTKLGQ